MQRDELVAEETIRLDRRRGALGNLVLFAHAQLHDQQSVRADFHVVHEADVHAREQHRLSLLQSGAPGELREQLVARLQAAAREIERSDDRHDQRDRGRNAHEDFVASFHPCKYGARRSAVMASSTRIQIDEITTAFAVALPTPSAPALVMYPSNVQRYAMAAPNNVALIRLYV